MHRAHPLVFAAAALALVAAACTPGGSLSTGDQVASFTGSDGVASSVSDTSRIVTLSGDLTEFVYELGAGSAIVATDITTVHPQEAALLPKVGIGRFLSTEAVLAQNPTLVIGDTQTGPQSAIDQIRAAGVPVVILETSTTFSSMYAKIGQLGEILDARAGAEALADQLRGEVAEAGAANPPSQESPSIAYVYTRGPDVMLLFGNDMVTNPVIAAAGARDAGALSGVNGSIPVTPEALIAAAPDIIVVPSEGLETLGGIDGLLGIPGIAQTPAGASGYILAYPEGDFLTLGPRVAESVAALTNDLRDLGVLP
ncbi:MAG: ABC transporter substrate-binding protein [Actinomycetia bacterium]|nr:ABC transporter substrate-binding protein [Actinomycetes bacterium]